ncbi:MAG: chromate efflux transporter [Rhodospirillales bacterium]|nr:chromate efflux transporter [Alphaproteobacteria bacterium]MBL6947349.1 chromate efflux transporter [Rhodospirillales bacterium]
MERGSVREVFSVFLKLGLTSFGGPVAHIGYFREEFVVRRKWLDDASFADLVALCQFMPGPASSQAGLGIGLARAGLPGAAAAWCAFTLPSALALVLFAYGVLALGDALDQGWLRGFKLAAVPIVAQAVWGMGRSLCPDAPRITLAAFAALGVLAWPTPLGQLGVILLGGVAGFFIVRVSADNVSSGLSSGVGRGTGAFLLFLFGVLLIGLPILASSFPDRGLALFDSFFRSGALVFGGGHVVLPLLQAEVVPPGWVSQEAFLAGYGATQAVPGPLFTFAAFLGTVMNGAPNGVWGAVLCLFAIFVPSFLLVPGLLPFWDGIRKMPAARQALAGINAAVVGLLLAALYNPVWTSAVRSPVDFGIVLVGFVLLAFCRTPPWAVVILMAAAGAAVQGLSGAVL